MSVTDRPEPPTQRRPYTPPELIPVHLDPVGELLQATNCNPQSGQLPPCPPPVCVA